MGQSETINYYSINARKYFLETVDIDMSSVCDKFISYVKNGGTIIDLGAGSGRDIKYFLGKGYQVDGLEASELLCQLASEYTGIKVECNTIEDWIPSKKYDGIWACASLLHFDFKMCHKIMKKIHQCMNEEGILYISLKSGIKTGVDDTGRFFQNFNWQDVYYLINKFPQFKIIDMWESNDNIDRKDFVWINLIVRKV